MELRDAIVELYRKAATELSKDVVDALRNAEKKEQNKAAKKTLQTILKNVELAKHQKTPICQDTGTPIFYIDCPVNCNQIELKKEIIEATKKATKEIPLRSNAVDSLTGKNSGDNVQIGVPVIHLEQWEKPELKISLMLKGGGSENVGRQYTLPDKSINASRDIKGIKKCVIDSVFHAQGKGCSPGIIGVAVGGSRDQTFSLSKKQFLRKLDDKNEHPDLAKLEKELVEKCNSLGIGPMGFGGKTTVLGVKVAVMHRHPASFFVAVSHMCWADRRKSMIFNRGKVKWLD